MKAGGGWRGGGEARTSGPRNFGKSCVYPALLLVLVETSSTVLCEEENVTAGELRIADEAGPMALSPSCHLTGSSA